MRNSNIEKFLLPEVFLLAIFVISNIKYIFVPKGEDFGWKTRYHGGKRLY